MTGPETGPRENLEREELEQAASQDELSPELRESKEWQRCREVLTDKFLCALVISELKWAEKPEYEEVVAGGELKGRNSPELIANLREIFEDALNGRYPTLEQLRSPLPVRSFQSTLDGDINHLGRNIAVGQPRGNDLF